jgi:putative ABC transport system permease protein
MIQLIQEVRYGIRFLSKNRNASLVIIFSFALGIGAISTMFSFGSAVLSQPLPYGNPARLLALLEPERGWNQNWVTPADFADLRAQNHVFEDMGACTYGAGGIVYGGGHPEAVMGFKASPNFFQVLDTKPAIGRSFSSEDGQPGSDPVVILNYGLWMRLFGGNPQVIGKVIRIDNNSFTVIGVMPRDFWFLFRQIELWVPLQLNPSQFSDRENAFLYGVARLKPGVSQSQARTEMNVIAGRLSEEYPNSNTWRGVTALSLRKAFLQDEDVIFFALFAAVAILLAISSTNAASLLLALAGTRQKEIAVRLSFGANRARIFRQLMTESTLLSGIGGAFGLILTFWGNRLVMFLLPTDFTWWLPTLSEGALRVSGRVFLFTLSISLLLGFLSALLPALRCTRLELAEWLKERSVSSASLMHNEGYRQRYLVTAEIALTATLLMSAGLTIKSLAALQQVDPGFRQRDLVMLGTILPKFRYPSDRQRLAISQQMVDRVRTLPGVDSAAVMDTFLAPPDAPGDPFATEDNFDVVAADAPHALSRTVSPDYFRTMGIPIIAGRVFTDEDQLDSPRVAVVSQTLARKTWHGKDPLGKRIKLWEGRAEPSWISIVGIVGDANYYEGLATPPGSTLYLAYFQNPGASPMIVVHTASSSLNLGFPLINSISSLDKELPPPRVQTISQILEDSLWQPRFSMLLLLIFALLATILAAIGVYGSTSYFVTQRSYEIGVRMALGATPSRVLRMIMGQALRVATMGLALGLALSLAFSRLLASQLYRVTSTDPITFVGVAAFLTTIMLLAAYIPASRATKIDPLDVLRNG